MSKFTVAVTISATGKDQALAQALSAVLQVAVERLVWSVEEFLSQRITPRAMCAFERGWREIGRELLRGSLECVVGFIEPADPAEVPAEFAPAWWTSIDGDRKASCRWELCSE